jgi:hypothetical protein
MVLLKFYKNIRKPSSTGMAFFYVHILKIILKTGICTTNKKQLFTMMESFQESSKYRVAKS